MINKLTSNPKIVYLYYMFPWMIGLLSLSSVSIIDGYFLGNYVGAQALAVVNLAFPVLSLISSVEIMIGTGSSIRCGRYLGEGNVQDASRIFTQSSVAIFVSIALLSLFAISSLDLLILLLGADESLAPLLYSYLLTILLFQLFLPSGFILNFFVALDNNPILSSVAMTSTAVINILLTWLFVVQLDLGIIGAALGSGISGFFGFIVLCGHFVSKKRQLQWVFVKKQWTEIFTTMKNGISDGIGDASSALFALIFNWIMIIKFGVNGLVAMAVVNFMLEIQSTMAFGLGDTLQMLVSANSSAKKYDRVSAFLKLSLVSGLIIGVVFILLTLFHSEAITAFFISQEKTEVLTLVNDIFHLIFPVFILSGFNIILMAYFSALEKPLYSGGIAFARTLFFPALLLLTLPLFLGDTGVFIAIVMAELLTCFLSIYFFKKSYGNLYSVNN